MGVVIRIYIGFLIIHVLLIPTPLVLALFCSSIPTFVHFLNVFSFLFMLFLCNIANIAQGTFEIVQKSRSHGHDNIIISIRMLTTSPEASTCEVPIMAS